MVKGVIERRLWIRKLLRVAWMKSVEQVEGGWFVMTMMTTTRVVDDVDVGVRFEV